jgi:hypothetical protein
LLKVRVIAQECIGSTAGEADWIGLGPCRRCHAENARRGKKWCQNNKKSSHFAAPFVFHSSGMFDCNPDDEINVGVLTSSIQLIVCVFSIDVID